MEDAITKVLAHIDRDELVALAAALIKINSVWDPEVGTNEQQAAEFVAAWAREKGFACQMQEVVPSRPNVIITWQGGPGERTLMFEGHTDVVTPGDPSTWSVDPFGAEIRDGRMYGRGSCDTKGNLAAMLIAMAALKNAGIPLSGSLVGGVLCDEEDQMQGVLDFIEQGHADQVTGAVICEPQDGLVCIRQKGAVRAEYFISGRMSHGAMPLSGLNTAPALAELIRGLQRLEQQACKHYGRDPYLGWPSFTPTVIQAPASGPRQLNVMPGEARLLVDVRTIPGQDHQQTIADLQEIARQAKSDCLKSYTRSDAGLGIERRRELEIQTSILTDRPCTWTPEDHPLVVAADRASRQISGKEPDHAGVPGATNGTFLWALKDIPIVTMGAGDRYVPHQKDEWVDLDQLVETARIYALTGLHYLS
jgi:succinyl-diaminopimelate desuccinylase